MDYRSVQVVEIGNRIVGAQGKFVGALRKLNLYVRGDYGSVSSVAIRKNLGRADDLAIERDINANHLICCLGPDRSVYLEIHRGVADGIEGRGYGKWANLIDDHLNCHTKFPLTRWVFGSLKRVKAPGTLFLRMSVVNHQVKGLRPARYHRVPGRSA